MRRRGGLPALLFSLAGLASASRAPAGSSGDELVRQARAHEAAHEDDVAVRRYMEALGLEPRHEQAWLGLGALRLRMGEALEAERVYDAALLRVPTLSRAVEGRAHARWAQGRHADAEADLESYARTTGGADALRELAGWYGIDGRLPAQLATWRRVLALSADEAAAHEARTTVKALVLLVGDADPASSPVDGDPTRAGLARMARRGL